MIHILWPTCRIAMYKSTSQYWKQMAKDLTDVQFHVVTDSVEQAQEVVGFANTIKIAVPTKFGVCWPTYCLSYDLGSKYPDNDIVILASDDFFPPKNWDVFVRFIMGKNPGKVVIVNDGYQVEYGTPLCTMPMMDIAALKKLNGVIYHPEYNHLYSDEELYHNAKDLKLVVDLRRTEHHDKIFEHRHHVAGKRVFDSTDKSIKEKESSDKRVYARRIKRSVNDRLKVVKFPIKLSLLIPSLAERDSQLQSLLTVLNAQMIPNVEIQINVDGGKKTIGAKRNELVKAAQGDYVAFIDDDDMVHPFYIGLILEAILKNGSGEPDCVSLNGVMTNGNKSNLFIHSMMFDKWFEEDGVYFRSPNHLNTIKRSIVEKVKFKSTNHGEDSDFSIRIYPKLKTEVNLDAVIYHYRSA